MRLFLGVEADLYFDDAETVYGPGHMPADLSRRNHRGLECRAHV